MHTGSFIRFDRRYALLLFAVALWIWIAYSIASHSTKRVIKATIIQSSTPLHRLDDPVHVTKKEVLWIDKLYFPKGNELRNPVYGYLGYRQNFLMLLDTDFFLHAPKKIRFIIYSDDGFRLKIDGKTIMEYVKDRPLSKSEATIKLPAGKHHLYIKYFQGYGQLGLIGYYKVDKIHFIGVDSNSVKFLEK